MAPQDNPPVLSDGNLAAEPEAWNVELVGQIGESSAESVVVADHFAYIGSKDKLAIFDVSDPVHSSLVGQVALSGSVHVQAVAGNRVYAITSAIGSSQGVLHVIDVSNPSQPVETGAVSMKYTLPVPILFGDYLYCSDGGTGRRVVSIANLAKPEELPSTWTPPVGTVAVDPGGRYLYIASSNPGAKAGLHIFDARDPASPIEVGFYEMGMGGTFSYSLSVRGEYAYLGDGSTLYVLDISNPAHPTLVSSYQPGSPVLRISLVGDYAYVLSDYDLRVVSIADPRGMVTVGLYRTPGTGLEISAAGSYAYVSTLERNGILVLRFVEPVWLRQADPSPRNDTLIWKAIASRTAEIPVFRPSYIPVVFQDSPEVRYLGSDHFMLDYRAGDKALSIGAGYLQMGTGRQGETEKITLFGQKATFIRYGVVNGVEESFIGWCQAKLPDVSGAPREPGREGVVYALYLQGLPADELLKIANSLVNISEGQTPRQLPSVGGSVNLSILGSWIGILLVSAGLLLRQRSLYRR